MRFLMLLVVSFLSVLPPAARAQDPNAEPTMKDTLAIEVALMYERLMKRDPDYIGLIELNSNLKNDPTRFGNDALIKTHTSALKNIYDSFNGDSVFLVKKRLTIKSLDATSRTLTVGGINPDEPFLFDLAGVRQYGIFVRNADDVQKLGPPFVYDDLYRAIGWQNVDQTFPAEIIVKPLAADNKPFQMQDGVQALPIIADIVEITLLNNESKYVILQKRFNDWTPTKPGSSLMDLKDNPLDKALDKSLVQ